MRPRGDRAVRGRVITIERTSAARGLHGPTKTLHFLFTAVGKPLIIHFNVAAGKASVLARLKKLGVAASENDNVRVVQKWVAVSVYLPVEVAEVHGHAGSAVSRVLAVKHEKNALIGTNRGHEDLFEAFLGVNVDGAINVAALELVLKAAVYDDMAIIEMRVLVVENLTESTRVNATKGILGDGRGFNGAVRLGKHRLVHIRCRGGSRDQLGFQDILGVFKHGLGAADLAQAGKGGGSGHLSQGGKGGHAPRSGLFCRGALADVIRGNAREFRFVHKGTSGG